MNASRAPISDLAPVVSLEARRKAAPARLEGARDAHDEWEVRRRKAIGDLPEGRARTEAGSDLAMQLAALCSFVTFVE